MVNEYPSYDHLGYRTDDTAGDYVYVQIVMHALMFASILLVYSFTCIVCAVFLYFDGSFRLTNQILQKFFFERRRKQMKLSCLVGEVKLDQPKIKNRLVIVRVLLVFAFYFGDAESGIQSYGLLKICSCFIPIPNTQDNKNIHSFPRVIVSIGTV